MRSFKELRSRESRAIAYETMVGIFLLRIVFALILHDVQAYQVALADSLTQASTLGGEVSHGARIVSIAGTVHYERSHAQLVDGDTIEMSPTKSC